MISAPINLIDLDERGVAYIAGTRMKVAEIAREKVGLGYSAEQSLEAHPHLTLAQIYAALSYYYSHREEVDEFQAKQDAFYEEFVSRNEHVTTRDVLEARRASANSMRRQSARAVKIAEEGAEYG